MIQTVEMQIYLHLQVINFSFKKQNKKKPWRLLTFTVKMTLTVLVQSSFNGPLIRYSLLKRILCVF